MSTGFTTRLRQYCISDCDAAADEIDRLQSIVDRLREDAGRLSDRVEELTAHLEYPERRESKAEPIGEDEYPEDYSCVRCHGSMYVPDGMDSLEPDVRYCGPCAICEIERLRDEIRELRKSLADEIAGDPIVAAVVEIGEEIDEDDEWEDEWWEGDE